MQKTVYQTPELRDANDNIIQEGAFGKNTALSNSTNDGWIDYVVNNLEALHDTIGDSAATLDGNGHVVEPANLAIGDEDGNRLKTSYLKLTGGTVSGTLNVAQNLKFQDNQENVFGGVYVPSSSATEQYAQFYGGENTGVAGAKLTLYPDGDGRFKLDARSTDGANTYTLVTDDNGNLNWRGYALAWKKDYLPVTGGTLSGWLQFSNETGRIQANRSNSGNDGSIQIYGGSAYSTGAYLWLNGIGRASQAGYFGIRAVTDGSTYKELQGRPDGTLTWGGKSVFRGSSNVASQYGWGGYEKNEANNTVKQWNRIGINGGASQTWTYGAAMYNANYFVMVFATNGNSITITSKTETAMTIQNNGSKWSEVFALVIGVPASQ